MTKFSLQSYDKVSINSSVYNFSTATKYVKIFIYSIIPYQSTFSTVPSPEKPHYSVVMSDQIELGYYVCIWCHQQINKV